MTPTLLVVLLVALALAFAAAWQRRADLQRQRLALHERAAMAARTGEAAPLQVPRIDLAKCLGCGTCVRECPEEGVLALVHGQAAVVNAAGCVGHARCVSECPAGAVTLSRGDLSQRRDVPALDGELQAIGRDGLFLVGEVTAHSLIRTAVAHGARVAATIARRVRGAGEPAQAGVDDAVIVGAGPGGFAAALGCRQHGLRCTLIDQEQALGGAVARYPRHKLVLTDVVDLPLHGRLAQREYQKEELMALWEQLAARHRVPFRGGVRCERIERLEPPAKDGARFVVHTDQGPLRTRTVVLAVGRRGTPRRLGVPGEQLPHVTYSLLDAAAHRGRQCVVVGGGDSAVEAAIGLAEQPDTRVTIVYRQDAFFRIRSKNRQRLEQRLADGRIEALLATDVTAIDRQHVEVTQRGDGGGVALQLRADDVFVLIGGEPPFAWLEQNGVSFDPALQPGDAEPDGVAPGGAGLVVALGSALLLTVAAFVFLLWHRDYYFAGTAQRAAEPLHATLRPDQSLGLWFGFAAVVAVVANLAYLLRRQQWWGVRFGSLASWLDVHIATGVVAVLSATLHAALSPRATPGGFALWGLVLLAATGAIGRWFYAWLPRNANGRELELATLRQQLAAAHAGRAAGGFAATARAETLALIDRRQWRATLPGRALALLGLTWDLWRTARRIRRQGAASGAEPAAVAEAIAAARAAHGAAVAVAHLEDLRALLSTWRWLHRWLALLMVLLVVVHVTVAILHGVFARGGGL